MCGMAASASGYGGDALVLLAARTLGELLERNHGPVHPALSEPFQHQRKAQNDE